MPVIDFPSSPSNNELFIAQGKAMRYNSDKNKWRQVTTLTSNQITELEGKTVGISSMSISGNTLVIQKDDSTHANVSLSAFAGNILTNYASASQLPITGLVAGSQVYVTDTDCLYITDGSGWYKIATVNLSPSLSLGVSSISMSGGGTVDVNYTVNEPEDTPYTITASATSNATITVHQSNNTLSFVAGGSSSSETITITATDGVNTVADTLTMTVTVLSYSSFTRTAVYGQSGMTGSGSTLQFGKTSNISNNGLVAAFGMPSRFSGRGAIAIFTNTSGDTSNTTSWSYLTEIDVPFNYSYANNGGSQYLGSSSNWGLGSKDFCMSADGSMIGAHFNKNSVDSQNENGTVIWERSGNTYNIHSVFNPWQLQNTTTNQINLRHYGQRISCDATMTRIAVPWAGSVGNSVTGRVDVYVRSGTTWTHEQTLSPFGNYNTPTGAYGPSGINSHGQISMSADGTRIMHSYASGYKNGDSRGMMYIWHRSGTTWSEEYHVGSAARIGFGTGSSMSGDGNHIIITQTDTVDGTMNQQRLKYYKWSGTNWSSQGEMNPTHLIPNPDFGPQNYHPFNGDGWGSGCSINYDGTICTVAAVHDDGYNNPTGGSGTGALTTYKRYDTFGASGNKPNNSSYWYFDKYIPMFESSNYNPNLGIGSSTSGGGWQMDDEAGLISGDGKAIVAGASNYNVGDEHLTGKGIIIQPT